MASQETLVPNRLAPYSNRQQRRHQANYLNSVHNSHGSACRLWVQVADETELQRLLKLYALQRELARQKILALQAPLSPRQPTPAYG